MAFPLAGNFAIDSHVQYFVYIYITYLFIPSSLLLPTDRGKTIFYFIT